MEESERAAPVRMGGQRLLGILTEEIKRMNDSDLMVVSTFRSTADAQVAKGILDGAGIESMIRSDNAGGMYPALAGAELLVRAEDLTKAADALRTEGQ